MMNFPPINSFWITGALQPVNYLTIKSFLANGHPFVLWSYDRNIIFEHPHFQLRDAREIMPESEIYFYKNMLDGKPHFKFGGIAERLKAELLCAVGGWHVDLDVTCLKPFDFEQDYVLRPIDRHGQASVTGNIIKAPAQSHFAKLYLAWTKTIDENNTQWTKSNEGVERAMRECGLEMSVAADYVFGWDEQEYLRLLTQEPSYFPDEKTYAIHWCEAWLRDLGWNKNYHPDSIYAILLKRYEL